MTKEKLEIHERFVQRAKVYLKSEAEIIECLQEVEEHKVYLEFECRKLHEYVIRVIGLSESVAWSFILVARKAREVPALKEAISTGKLQVQKARKITSVLTGENQDYWIKLAVDEPQRVVEREVARVNPGAARPERLKPVSENRWNVNLNASNELSDMLRRAQDLESQRLKRAATIEMTLEASLRSYLETHDPLQKAKRAEERQKKKVANSEQEQESATSEQLQRTVSVARQIPRRPVAAKLKHQINLRDEARCIHTDKNGNRCQEKRWIQFHHIVPVSRGGRDTLENLATLCFGHHKLVHEEPEPRGRLQNYT
ncbi:MAG: HNH endonuclease signature motif containing protein [Bdellovibrionia bacterium]